MSDIYASSGTEDQIGTCCSVGTESADEFDRWVARDTNSSSLQPVLHAALPPGGAQRP